MLYLWGQNYRAAPRLKQAGGMAPQGWGYWVAHPAMHHPHTQHDPMAGEELVLLQHPAWAATVSPGATARVTIASAGPTRAAQCATQHDHPSGWKEKFLCLYWTKNRGECFCSTARSWENKGSAPGQSRVLLQRPAWPADLKKKDPEK